MPTKQQDYEATARKTGAQIRHVINATSGEVSEVAEHMESRIVEQPVKSTLIALGAGLLLGLLLRRR